MRAFRPALPALGWATAGPGDVLRRMQRRLIPGEKLAGACLKPNPGCPPGRGRPGSRVLIAVGLPVLGVTRGVDPLDPLLHLGDGKDALDRAWGADEEIFMLQEQDLGNPSSRDM